MNLKASLCFPHFPRYSGKLMHSAWKQLETAVCLSRFSSAVHLKELFLRNFVVQNYRLFSPLCAAAQLRLSQSISSQ
jgi:hypothetical protein